VSASPFGVPPPHAGLATLLRHGRRVRTIGIDDGPFRRGSRGPVLVVGAIYAGAEFEGLLSTRVRQDGWNATTQLARMLLGSKFHAQLHLVLLDGITLGGFNVVDLPRLADEVQLPCAAVMRRPPDLPAVRRALARLPGKERRLHLVERAGPIHSAGGAVCFQVAGADPEPVREALLASLVHGQVPECLRGAHLIASGLENGQSGRRA
jgi:uncharacterized protein